MPQFSTLSRYGIGKRYGLAPVWAQQRKPGSQQKKKRARAPAKKAEWNAYLTDAGRYKLPAKEVERRKSAHGDCGPRRAIADAAAAPTWHKRAPKAAATPERRPRGEPSSAATTVGDDVFDLLADGDAPAAGDAARPECPATAERDARPRRALKFRRSPSPPPRGTDDAPLRARVQDLEDRLEGSEAARRKLEQRVDDLLVAVADLQARETRDALASVCLGPMRPATPPRARAPRAAPATPPPPASPPPPPGPRFAAPPAELRGWTAAALTYVPPPPPPAAERAVARLW